MKGKIADYYTLTEVANFLPAQMSLNEVKKKFPFERKGKLWLLHKNHLYDYLGVETSAKIRFYESEKNRSFGDELIEDYVPAKETNFKLNQLKDDDYIPQIRIEGEYLFYQPHINKYLGTID